MKKMKRIDKMKKGITMPTNMIVILIIAVLVLVILAFYFSGVVSISMSEAEAQKVFREGCLRYCEADTEQNYINAYQKLAYRPSSEDRKFLTACERLGYGARPGYEGDSSDFPNRCLEFCGKYFCDMEVTHHDIIGKHNQIITSLS